MSSSHMKEIKATERNLKIIGESFQKMIRRQKRLSLYIASANSEALYSMFNFDRFKDYVREYLLENKNRDVLQLSLNDIFEESKNLLQLFDTNIKLLTEDPYHPIYEFATIEDASNYLKDYITIDQFPHKSNYTLENLNQYCNSIIQFLSTVIFADKTNAPNNDKPETSLQYPEVTNIFCRGMPIGKAEKHFSEFERPGKNKKPFLTEEQIELFIKKAFYGEQGIHKQSFNYNPQRETGLIIYHFYQFYCLAQNEHFEDSNQCRDKYIKLLTDNFINWDFNKVRKNFAKKYKHQL